MKRVNKLLSSLSILLLSSNVFINSISDIYASEINESENTVTSETIESSKIMESELPKDDSSEILESDSVSESAGIDNKEATGILEEVSIELTPNNADPIGPAAEEPGPASENEIIIQSDEVTNLDVYNREEIHRLAIEMMNQDLASKGIEPTSTSFIDKSFSTRNISSGIEYVDRFIATIAPYAIDDSITSGILPSITIAQGALESAWGRSGLTTEANNLFGIKASSDWTGEIYNVITSEYSDPVYDNNGNITQQGYWYQVVAPFRKYSSWLGSIKDHGAFFTGTEWRKNNYRYVVGEKDYRKAAQALQDAGYATDPSYASLLIRIIENYGLDKFDKVPILSAEYHVQDKGWLSSAGTHLLLGTTGQSLRLEELRLSFPNNDNVGIEFSSYVEQRGWSGWIPEGLDSGNTGKSLRMEALKIRLTGINSNDFDILYRVHTQNFGWSGWTKNGLPAGHEGYGKRIEAVEVRVVWAGEIPLTNQEDSYHFYTSPSVTYSTHVETYGWLGIVYDGIISGTTGQSKRLEGICIGLHNQPYSGQINYQTHVQTYGWMPSVSDGAISGTTGQSKRLEAIKINLTGDMATYFDVYYRTHIQDYGWMGWTKNGLPSGSEGLSKRLESIQIVLVKKGEPAPGSTLNSFYR